jgi:hypothetical protein
LPSLIGNFVHPGARLPVRDRLLGRTTCTYREGNIMSLRIRTLAVTVVAASAALGLAACASTDAKAPAATPTMPAASTTSTAAVSWDLQNATLPVPSWGSPLDQNCAHDSVKFTNGAAEGGAHPDDHLQIDKVITVDLDGDGRPEALAQLECRLGAPVNALVAYTHDASGAVKLLAKIDAPTEVHAVEADGSRIKVQVGNGGDTDATAVAREITQWRTYALKGTAFAQVAGSTSFTVDDPQVTVETTDLVFVNGRGTMKVSIMEGTGGQTHANVVVHAAGGNTQLAVQDVKVNDLGPTEIREVTLTFTADAATIANLKGRNLGDEGFVLQIRSGDQILVGSPKLGKVIA